MAIDISRLRRNYAAFAALDDVSLSVADGEFVALLGPSGSGKTSLLRILAGLDHPDAGTVYRDSQDLLALDARRRGVGLVFQHYALFPHMTVAQNVAFGLRVRPWRQRPRAAEIRTRVEDLLRRVELDAFAARYPAQLSGGQRQRVALARALAIEPKLLLLDEPFGALDAQVRVNLRSWLRQLHRTLGITTLFVTHDQEEALEMADRVVVMNRGRIEQIGTPEQVYRQPATPFVFRFMGRGQQLPGHLEGSILHVLGRALPVDALAGLRAPAPDIFVRPENVLLLPLHSEGWAARIASVRHVPGSVRVGLELVGFDQSLEAEWSERDVARHSLSVGDQVNIHLQTLTVFTTDKEGGVLTRHDCHPPIPAGSTSVAAWRRHEG